MPHRRSRSPWPRAVAGSFSPRCSHGWPVRNVQARAGRTARRHRTAASTAATTQGRGGTRACTARRTPEAVAARAIRGTATRGRCCGTVSLIAATRASRHPSARRSATSPTSRTRPGPGAAGEGTGASARPGSWSRCRGRMAPSSLTSAPARCTYAPRPRRPARRWIMICRADTATP